MTHSTFRTPAHPNRPQSALMLVITLTIALILGIVALAVFGQQLLAGPAAGATEGPRSVDTNPAGLPGPEAGQDSGGGSLGEADGVLPSTASVFETGYPAIGQLNPALLESLQLAATTAAAEGIEFNVNSGWRSPALQLQLQQEAVQQYGSAEEAARWVATPETSAHVSGDAVDVGPFDASYWLQINGAQFGLCQVYANESWHFELRAEAPVEGCPLMYENPTEDPAMQG